ncbi:hypothetical protein EN852_023450 [Mesorhizobium sp. M2E.F.Ca.ET.209.01.1.1]|uniref:hypothetical protein n=1 Tax=Mesorhizobium sp. M2E.F.Ca.ET.209.01.1.1 TaxID=2500526 RepID=UPI000FD7F6A9|nr:hypothetical protein [Mesorhizobium sp. M2E.F.Ca.ET.209.01.1.1]TGS11326.1 hypothetical protein EN852_023450 [Mesorhizobium sp. M2E.F.Ca.ET.209.01.1.1]
MGELLDRNLQRTILGILSEGYPQRTVVAKAFEGGGNRLDVNLAYLEEHGLVSVHWHNGREGRTPMQASITAKGLDFIADDGGLGAILGVVTVRIHGDTLRELLISRVESSGEDETIKAKVVAKLRDIPADALGTLATKALDASLASLPAVAAWMLALLAR